VIETHHVMGFFPYRVHMQLVGDRCRSRSMWSQNRTVLL